jgi:hypothetical protein
MAATREMKSPMVTVKRDESGDDPMVRVRVAVPGSKFGPVEVVLYEYEAEALAADILEILR